MFSIIAKLTAMKRWVSLPPIVWIGLTVVLGGWQSLAQAETGCNGNIQLVDNLCDSLIAYYPLNDNPNDVSGNGNDGIEQSGVNYLAGKNAQAANFDGVDDYIEVADSTNLHLGTDSLSVSMWINANTFEGKDQADSGIRPLSKNGFPATWWVTDILPSGQVQMAIKDTDAVKAVDKKSTSAITTGQWYHLVTVVDRGNSVLKYYIDGTLDATHVLPTFGDIDVNGSHFEIGSGSFNPFNGLIDELYLHRRVLTDAEVQVIYRLETVATNCNDVTEIPVNQCLALVALYDSTNGDNWTDKTGWKKGNTPCSWNGITCADGKVVTIALNANNLDGTIPNLSTLTQLTNLSFADNQLTGVIPNLSSLTQLQNFDLGKNQLTGKIPELKTLTQIQRLNLVDNQLEGPIPDLLAVWPELHISGNSLCQNSEADYAGRTEVDAFPICPDIILSTEANMAKACIGRNLTITVKKQLSKKVDAIQFVMTFDPNHFRIDSLNGSGTFDQELTSTSPDLKITSSQLQSASVEGEFNVATIKLTPLVSSAGTPLQFNEGLTFALFNKDGQPQELRQELQGITVAIETCPPLSPIPSRNSPIWTLVDDTAGLNMPKNIILDGDGNFYIADSANRRVLKRDPQSNLTVIAGNGKRGFAGDNGPATEARLNDPQGLAMDDEGNLYIADTNNNRIRKVDSNGIITTVVGTDEVGTDEVGRSEDGELATAAQLNKPTAIIFDTNGHFYIADTGNNRICKINHKIGANSTITTFAGNDSRGYKGDNVLATRTSLYKPSGLAFDSQNNLYIADTNNYRIRKVDNSNIITTVAGNGEKGYSGDGNLATDAKLNMPVGLAIDGADNLYIADQSSHRIRKVSSENGLITTFTGIGIRGIATDGILAGVAQINQPTDVMIDPDGNMYFVEQGNAIIRQISKKDAHYCENSEVVDIPIDECYALWALYDGTKGPDWTDNSGWSTIVDTPTSPCGWKGVTCAVVDGDNHVTAIELPNNNLVGNMSTYIGDLVNLLRLDLSENNISGTIPITIGHLNNLTSLNLANNELIGNLPAEVNDVVRSQTINLADNQLSGKIPALDSLMRLENLDLSNNHFSGKVPAFPLETVDITGNEQLCSSTPVAGLEICPTEASLPIAKFTATPQTGQAPLTIQLDGWPSDAKFIAIEEFLWESSDGRKFTGPTPSITFANSGTYEISLRLINIEGAPSANTAKRVIKLGVADGYEVFKIKKSGEGIGVVSVYHDRRRSFSCRARCKSERHDYPLGSELDLRVRVALGSQFAGWDGDCVGTREDEKIKLRMDVSEPPIDDSEPPIGDSEPPIDNSKQCTAFFRLDDEPPEDMFELKVNSIGVGGSGGDVTVRGVVCEEPPCRGYYPQDRMIRIAAIPKPHAYFKTWDSSCPILGSLDDATNLVILTKNAKCTAHFGSDSDPAAEDTAKDFEQNGEIVTDMGENLNVTEIYSEVYNRERYEQAFLFAEKAMMTAGTQLVVPGEEASWPDQFDEVENFLKLPPELWVKKVRIVSSGETIDGNVIKGQYVRVDVKLFNQYTKEDEQVTILVYYGEEPEVTLSTRRGRGRRIAVRKRW